MYDALLSREPRGTCFHPKVYSTTEVCEVSTPDRKPSVKFGPRASRSSELREALLRGMTGTERPKLTPESRLMPWQTGNAVPAWGSRRGVAYFLCSIVPHTCIFRNFSPCTPVFFAILARAHLYFSQF